jgi:hypothetical protein
VCVWWFSLNFVQEKRKQKIEEKEYQDDDDTKREKGTDTRDTIITLQ